MELKPGFYQIHIGDNVVTALSDMPVGLAVVFGASSGTIHASEPVTFGHKIALRPIAEGNEIIKYGYTIGVASRSISEGEGVGTANCVSRIGVTENAGVYQPGAGTLYMLAEYPQVSPDEEKR